MGYISFFLFFFFFFTMILSILSKSKKASGKKTFPSLCMSGLWRLFPPLILQWESEDAEIKLPTNKKNTAAVNF